MFREFLDMIITPQFLSLKNQSGVHPHRPSPPLKRQTIGQVQWAKTALACDFSQAELGEVVNNHG